MQRTPLPRNETEKLKKTGRSSFPYSNSSFLTCPDTKLPIYSPRFELPQEKIDSITLPTRSIVEVDSQARKAQLKFLKDRLAQYEAKLAELLQQEQSNNAQSNVISEAPAEQTPIQVRRSTLGGTRFRLPGYCVVPAGAKWSNRARK
jgi:TolA-binding protein